MTLFFFALTLLCSHFFRTYPAVLLFYFPLPCCALIFLRTYPAVPLFFYGLTLLCPYPALRLPLTLQVLLRPAGLSTIYSPFELPSAAAFVVNEACSPRIAIGWMRFSHGQNYQEDPHCGRLSSNVVQESTRFRKYADDTIDMNPIYHDRTQQVSTVPNEIGFTL